MVKEAAKALLLFMGVITWVVVLILGIIWFFVSGI